jgi:hypothetical protein
VASKSSYSEGEKGAEIQDQLDVLDKLVDRVRVLYEQYFMGMAKQPPSQLHTDAERKVRDLTQVQIRNTALRYRFATITQKFGSYNTYWRRTLREIEQGRYLRDLSRIKRNAMKHGDVIPAEILAAMPKRMQEMVERDRLAAIAIQARRAGRHGAPGETAETGAPAAVVRDPGSGFRLDDLGDDPDLLDAIAREAEDAVERALRIKADTRPPLGQPGTWPPPVGGKPNTTPPPLAAARPVALPATTTRLPTVAGVPPAPGKAPPPMPGAAGGARAAPPPMPSRAARTSQGPRTQRIARTDADTIPTPMGAMTGDVPAPGAGPRPAPPAARPGTETAAPPPPPRLPAVPRRAVVKAAEPPPGMSEADTRALYAKFLKARQIVGESNDGMTYDKLVRTLRQQGAKIMDQYSAKGVEFGVVIKDNKVVLKAKPK